MVLSHLVSVNAVFRFWMNLLSGRSDLFPDTPFSHTHMQMKRKWNDLHKVLCPCIVSTYCVLVLCSKVLAPNNANACHKILSTGIDQSPATDSICLNASVHFWELLSDFFWHFHFERLLQRFQNICRIKYRWWLELRLQMKWIIKYLTAMYCWDIEFCCYDFITFSNWFCCLNSFA